MPGAHAPWCINAKNCTRCLSAILTETIKKKHFCIIKVMTQTNKRTRRDHDGGEQTWTRTLDKTESPSKICMRGVSTQQWPTCQKHSDYFVWKDTAERVARRCDDSIDKKRVNSCVLKHLFWRELGNQKITKNSWKFFLRPAANVTFSNLSH